MPTIASHIDHSLLKPTLTIDELEAGLAFARQARVASVCILPYYMARTAEVLAGSGVRTSTVVAFPHGAQSLDAKLGEIDVVLADGCEEVDAVINLSLVRSGGWDAVATEMREMTARVHGAGQRIKLIFENCYLNQDEKRRLCELATNAGVDWVKTSTGYGSGGATLEDVRLMRELCPGSIAVKAAGGIADLDTVKAFLDLGANRIGTSRTQAILEEAGEL